MTELLTQTDVQQRDEFVERLLKSTAGVFDMAAIYLGSRLGFYQALADSEGLTSIELSERTSTAERYAREWLEQQTVTGILTVQDTTLGSEARKFRLPAAYKEVLVDRESLNYLTPLSHLVMGALHPIDALLKAYRTGGGVPYRDYGPDMLEGQAAMNRTMFLQQLGSQWLPAMADVHSRLQADPPARIADIGCGAGWSSIGMAQAYPKVRIDGFDFDDASVELANTNLKQYPELVARLSFQVRDAGDPALAGQYDLVTAFECLHDMSNPVAALQAMRKLAGDKGTVFIADERVGDTFTSTGNEVEWMMYGWSILHCLPVGMVDQPSAQTGTVMRAETLKGYAREAGFQEVEIVPLENFFFRFYRLS